MEAIQWRSRKMTSFLEQILLICSVMYASTIPQETSCLKLDSLNVPHIVVEGETAVLTCPFSLESDRLYSVMWYKDHEEFYRFVPRNIPMQHSYQLEGFQIDMQMSNEQQVFLKDVSLKATGLYRCEVSAEAPSFSSVHDEAPMQVISIPDEDPQIGGEKSEYSVGDVMVLNCTSGRSFPPAKLEWYINDIPIMSETELLPEDSGLVASTTTLFITLEPDHFFQGQMIVRCVATVGPIQTYVHIAPLLVNHKETSLLVQARGSSAGIILLSPIALVSFIINLYVNNY